jgi:ABC-type glutathione transport system ATPase component
MSTTTTAAPVLDVRDLVVRYPGAAANAVDGVSFRVAPGETLALVGESGSGKSSIARAVLGLQPASGSRTFEGADLAALRGRALRSARARAQMIFQDPFGTLDPRMTIGAQIAEPLRVHGIVPSARITAEVADLLTRVGLDPAMARRFPHEFSGGQRQRIAIARAIGLRPRLIVCDEPTSALDVSVQAQVLALLTRLQRETGVAYLFIAHNLGVVRQVAHRVAVMRNGRFVETGPVDEVFEDPQADYTRTLLDSVLEPDPALRRRQPAGGEGR